MRDVLGSRGVVRSFESARARERGGVLVLALVAVMAVAAMSMTFFQLSSSVTRSQRQAVDRKKAFYLAEAGLAEAFAGLSRGKTGNVGSESQPAMLGEGLFWVVASELPSGETQLECTGMAGGSRVILDMVVAAPTINVGALGIFSDRSMTLPAGSSILGMDSSAKEATEAAVLDGGTLLEGGGGGAESSSSATAMVGSNEGITLEGTARLASSVEGDVRPGPGYSVTLGTGSTVSGSQEARSASIALPALALPDIKQAGEVDWVSPVPLVVPPGEYGYAALRAHELTDIELQGPLTLYLGEFSLQDTAVLTLDTTGGAIEIHVDDAIRFVPGSEIVVEGDDPARLLLHLAADQGEGSESLAQLESSSEFYGQVYSPSADVEIGGSFQVQGSLVGRTLIATESLSLVCDQALVEAGGLSELEGLSWCIVEMPDSAGGRGGINPFNILNVDPDTLPAPDDAHEDQSIRITYTDKVGTTKTYDGMESAFDWEQVDSWDQLQRSRDGEYLDMGAPPEFSDADADSDLEMRTRN